VTGARAGFAWLALSIVIPASGQSPGRLDLVRCAAASDAPCFQASGITGTTPRVIGVGVDGLTGLGRGAFRRAVVLRRGADSVASAMSWRPPLLAMPTFRGVADSALLAPILRDALIAGTLGGTDRPVITIILATLIGMLWLAVGRLGWHDDEPLTARSKDSTMRTAISGSPADEAPPRKPDDVTRQTARRTALRR